MNGCNLRHFRGFELLDDPRGATCFEDFQRKIPEAATAHGLGVINEGLHYRASRDRDSLIGHSRDSLGKLNLRSASEDLV